MASEQNKQTAITAIVATLEELSEFKQEIDDRIDEIYIANIIGDPTIQAAIKDVAKAIVASKLNQTHARAAEVESLCQQVGSPGSLFDTGGGDE